MDEYIEQLLTEESVFEVILPALPKRRILEQNEDIDPRISILEADLELDNYLAKAATTVNESDDDINIDIDKIKTQNDYESSGSEDEDVGSNTKKEEGMYIDEQPLQTGDRWKKYDDDEEFKNRGDKFHSFNSKAKYQQQDYVKSNKNDEVFIQKKRRNDDNKKEREHSRTEDKKDEKVLDPNSAEYWLEMRKKLGI